MVEGHSLAIVSLNDGKKRERIPPRTCNMKHLVHVGMLPRGGRLLPGGASGRSRTSSHVTSLSRYNNRPQARDGTCSKTVCIGHLQKTTARYSDGRTPIDIDGDIA